MRIGLFTDTYFPQVSGVATSIKTLADALRKRGHEVYIITTTDPAAAPKANVIRLKSIPFLAFEDRRVVYGDFVWAYNVIKKLNLDVIHTHTEFGLGLFGIFIARRLNLPIVHTYHTLYENYTHYILNGKLIRASHVHTLSKIYCNNVDGVIAPSQLTKDKLISYGVSVPIHIAATGVDVPKYDKEQKINIRKKYNLPEDARIYLSLCRLSQEKSVDEVLRVFKKVEEKDQKAYLLVVGKGPAREELEELSRSLSLKRVIFTGEIPYDDVWKYYQASDLYLNASQSETQGLTFLEALVNRLPIIAHRNPYLTSIMKSSTMGRLFDEDYSFISAIDDFMNSSEETIDIETLYPLSSQAFAEKVEDIYSITDGQKRRRLHGF